MVHKGETWNESELYRDPWTLRPVRRVTTQGLYNQSPNYHTNIGFSADGEFLIFASARENGSAIFKCHLPPRLRLGLDARPISTPASICDPTGRWIAYNAAARGRSDVFVVEV